MAKNTTTASGKVKANKGATDTVTSPTNDNGEAAGKYAGKRTDCPFARATFVGNQVNEEGKTIDPGEPVVGAQPLAIDINGDIVEVAPKLFSTGSFGWWSAQKMEFDAHVIVGHDDEGEPIIATHKVKCQAQLSFVIVNSKEAPNE